MIKLTVLYPNAPDATFDMNYYVTHHLPLVRDRCAPVCRSIAAEGGIASAEPGVPAPYIAIGHLVFDSVEAFQRAFAPHAPEILGDIPRFTNTKPTIQISNITL